VKWNKAVVLLMVVFMVPALTLAGEAQPEGEALYHNYCAGCHGHKAVGEDPGQPWGGWREDGSRIAPALNGTAHSWHHEPALLFNYVKSGSVDPESPMPSFGNILKDDQIRAIILYYQSLWPEKIRRIYEKRFPGALKKTGGKPE
jgi:mono/diheme cytochrome c family protein